MRASSSDKRLRPAFVRYGKFERGRRGGFLGDGPPVDEAEFAGRRRVFAFGKERNVGQICCVGGPVIANILLIVAVSWSDFGMIGLRLGTDSP